MESRNYLKWAKNYQHANAAPAFSRLSYLPMPLRKLPEAFGLSTYKSWHSHYFNTKANLDYVGPIPDIKYYSADELGRESERTLCLGTTVRESRSSITDAFWNSIAKMTSQSCDRRVRFLGAILSRSEISRFS
jgi:hypothetical protein